MREEKKGIVNEIVNEIKDVNPLLFTDYMGIKANDFTQLRSKLMQSEAKYKVVKNRLLKRALADVGVNDMPLDLKGPLGIAYGGNDIILVVKTLVEFAKDYPDTINVKGGFVDNAFLDLNKIEALAKLPSKEVLIAKLVSQIGSPLTKMVIVLQANIQKLACALNEIKNKKS